MGEKPSSTRQASRLSRTAQTQLALVSCLENSWGWGGAERGTPRTEVIFRDKRGVALGWGSTKWAELSQWLGCWLPWRPAEGQALPSHPKGHFLALHGPFSSQELPSPFATAGLVGGGRQGSLPADGQHTHDDDGCAELFHAFLDDDAIDGPASVVGKEGLSCRRQGGLVGASADRRGLWKPPDYPHCLPHSRGFSLSANSCLAARRGRGQGALFSEIRNIRNVSYSVCTDWILLSGITAPRQGEHRPTGLLGDSHPLCTRTQKATLLSPILQTKKVEPKR